jgi:hypothetical protein
MEAWTAVQAKKKPKDIETDSSATEEDGGSTTGSCKEKARVHTRRKETQSKSKGSDTDSSKEDETDDTTASSKPKERSKSGRSAQRDKTKEDVSDHGESDTDTASLKDRRCDKKPSSKGKPKTKRSTSKVRLGRCKYYAVARGRESGVYKSWQKAKRQVEGFSDARHKSFHRIAEAEEFVRKHRKRRSKTYESSEDSLDSSSSESEASSTEERPRRGRAHQKFLHPSIAYLVPDPSMGEDEKFFLMETADIRSMVIAMSPPDVDFARSKMMAAAAFDAVQLPGRCSTGKEDNNPRSLVEAISDLNEDRRSGKGPRRDVHWQATSRTSLRTIKSHKSLQDRLTELQGLKGDVYKNQVHTYQAILSELPWEEASILAWAQLNWYQRIGLDTFENYLNLHRHLIDLSLQQGWEYAAVSLEYHTTKLASIRTQAPSRLCCMVRIYIFLHDAINKSFYSEKLQEKRNQDVRGELEALKTFGGGGAAASCPKCGMAMHSGGVKNCPLRNLSDADGRKKMQGIWEQLAKITPEQWDRMLATDD